MFLRATMIERIELTTKYVFANGYNDVNSVGEKSWFPFIFK